MAKTLFSGHELPRQVAGVNQRLIGVIVNPASGKDIHTAGEAGTTGSLEHENLVAGIRLSHHNDGRGRAYRLHRIAHDIPSKKIKRKPTH